MPEISSTSPVLSAILLCPRAGQLKVNPTKLAVIRRITAGRGWLFEPRSVAMLEQDCRELFALRPARVIVVGGDGSLMRVLSELYRVYGEEPLPRFVLVPVGTVNLTAKRWGITKRPEALIERALSQPVGQVVSRPSLKVLTDGRTHIAFTVGTGLVSHFFEAYEQEPAPGVGAAAKIFCRTFFGSFVNRPFARRILSPVRARLTVGARDWGQLGLTLLVCSVFRDLGLGLKPTYRAGTVPGQLHLVASTLPARTLGPLALRALLGKPLRKRSNPPEVLDCLTEQFGLELAEPTRIVLDGDTVRACHVTVEAGPMLSVERV